MKRKHLLLPVLVLILTFFFFRPGKEYKQDVEMKSKGSDVANEVDTSSMAPVRDRIEQKKATPTITEAEINSMRASIPDKIVVKEEVAESPHTTPKSLIVFAEALGPLMDRGLHNVEDAKLLSEELYGCVSSESVPTPARTLCFSSMEKLVKVHPELKEKFEVIQDVAPGKVIKLNQSVKGLGK